MYAYKSDGGWVFPVNMKSRHRDIGGWHLLTDLERAVHGWYPVVLVNDFVPYGKVKGTYPLIKLSDNVVTVTYDLLDVDISTLRADKMKEIKTRFDVESTLPVIFLSSSFKGGQRSAETADGKARLAIRAGENSGGTQPFLTTFNDVEGIQVPLNTDQLQDLAVAIGIQYEAAFQKQAQLERDLKLTTINTINAFDVDILWAAL